MKLKRALLAATCLLAVLIGSGGFAQDTNQPPVVEIVEIRPFSNESLALSYVLYDAADDAAGGDLTYGLYFYPDDGLESAADVETWGTMIANEKDVTLDIGSGNFREGDSAEEVLPYVWGEPGVALQKQGFAPITKVFDGEYFLYLVADDGVNEPVFSVAGPVRIDHSQAATGVAQESWGRVKAALR